MGYLLIVTEKPSAAKKIAEALADKTPKRKVEQTVSYYELTHKGKEIIIVPAVGHLYGLEEVKKTKGFAYPVFDIHWVPIADIRKDASYSKKYLNVIKKLAKKAESFCLATDFDIEGETLGYNIIRFACEQEDAKRMKFSTLTKQDLLVSFDNLLPTIEWGQARAGVTRHSLDWYYGINISRALTHAITQTGMFKILSTGRVQGPALKILVEREREIKAFIPDPFWQIELLSKTGKTEIQSWHDADKFWKVKEADAIMKKVTGATSGDVTKVAANQIKQRPPTPFDLTTLQTEAYRCLNISPKHTLSFAQELYLAGLISYPRTSSQQLPESIGYKSILKQLMKQSPYVDLAQNLLNLKSLIPNNGKKVDPAHPAIYPTGVTPKEFKGKEKDLYDLIVRRFMATFGENAVRETTTITITINSEHFIAKGTRTAEPGWHIYYGKHVRLEEQEMPLLNEGETVKVKDIIKHDKETQPPKRYTESSIIKELEKRGLGTKATRASIIDTLVRRTYVTGKPLEATQLGVEVCQILEKYSPGILDEKMTRRFEEDLEKIREEKSDPDKILADARKFLIKLLKEFKSKEKNVGEELKKTFTETREAMSTVGKCLKCKDGMLSLRRGKFGRFIACNKYPDCATTFSLPAAGMVKPTDKSCETCKHPMIMMIRKAKKPQVVCMNTDCPDKKLPEDKGEEGKP